MYLRAYEHSYALTKNCLRTKNARKKSFVRQKKKSIEFATMTRCTNNVEDLEDEKWI